MDWFTSDHHFGHKNIIGYCDRPFATVEEMDEAMVRRWNVLVQPEDTVYYVGDFAFATKDRIRELLGTLHGTKHLIRGNHDKPHSDTFWKSAGFATVQAHLRPVFPEIGTSVYMCHYPEFWQHSGVQLHGHVHNSRGMHPLKMYKATGQIQVNVSVEVWDYGPASITEIVRLIDRQLEAECEP